MNRLLLRESARLCAAAVGLAFLLVGFAFGLDEALALLLGGGLATLSFVGLVYLVGQLLDGQVSSKKKGWALALLVGKLAAGALILWAALIRYKVPGLGVVIGIGAAILGFTLGATRATNSPEGQAAMRAEEERIAREEEQKGS